MSKTYNPSQIEKKWQERWSDAAIFQAPAAPAPDQEKAYILDMFPYPSGKGLHVGHLLGYTGSDVLARHARLQGKAVLHPMGWDAFGLPAENFAIKTGVHPAISTAENTPKFRSQLQQIGFSYDWSREINTSAPEYYKWTQWLFQVLYNKGLAYRKEGLVNWCASCQTVLANEQVVQGKCDRCGHEVVQRNLKQWYFRITDYADRLLNDLDTVDWPEKIKNMQRNWIGRSEGAEVEFAVENSDQIIPVFTTRIDTIFGGTFLILAPDHPLVETLTTPDCRQEVTEYQEVTARKNELERTDLAEERTGVFIGAYAINPATNTRMPIWIADFVLSQYGTGAVFADAHDERDFDLAKKYDIPLRPTLTPPDGNDLEAVRDAKICFSGDGILYDSAQFNGMHSAEARPAITAWLETQGKAHPVVRYRLRDWLVSRQRFWGAPIPVMYDEAGQERLVPADHLPVQLPMNVTFKPTGQSPLVDAKEWRQVEVDGKIYQREADTLDGFVCSSWYFLRFPTPQLDQEPFDSASVSSWLPVDVYLGGAEHAVMHLLYARFITKVLFDAGFLPFEEPFQRLRNQGMILGPDHQKMSKSKGNIISQEEVVAEYGSDSLRLYELFMGPFDQEKPWDTKGIVGVRRFLEKVWRLQEKVVDQSPTEEESRILHQVIKKVGEDIEALRFNTAIAAMMEAVNGLAAQPQLALATYMDFLILLNPFAPHITEELWEAGNGAGFCSTAPWPAYDEAQIAESSLLYPIQVNGKVRAKVSLPAALQAPSEIQAAAEQDPAVQKALQGLQVRKVIVVPGRLISYVV